jgi:ribosomal protein L37AE/L43A
MVKKESESPKQKPEFKFCPNCGRKGLYHIKLQYYRCRYCGTYIIQPFDENEPIQPE